MCAAAAINKTKKKTTKKTNTNNKNKHPKKSQTHIYKNKNTKDLLAVDPAEGPVSVQLFGSDPEIMAAIAARIEDGPYVAIDVNMGCPVP